MELKIQIIVSIVIIVALCVIVNMIRKKALELKYALIWLGVGASILMLNIFPNIMEWLTKLMGIQLPVNMLFFLGFCFSLIILFSLTVVVSRMSIRIKELSQEIALYHYQNEKLENDESNNIKVL